MRRTIPLALAATMLLGASPILAADEDQAETTPTQRVEAAEFGLAVEFPADWRVSTPEGLRVSALTNAEGEDVMETTAAYANAGGGTWCDVDVYLGLQGGLEGHAYAYVNYLQQNEGPDSAMVVAETEIPAGPAYRIEIFDQATGRIRAMYLFDGPAGDDGNLNRYLLTCASREADVPFWETIAESAEVFAPVPATDGDEATEAETEESTEAPSDAEGDDAAGEGAEPSEEPSAEG